MFKEFQLMKQRLENLSFLLPNLLSSRRQPYFILSFSDNLILFWANQVKFPEFKEG